jgi:hypothetical protein
VHATIELDDDVDSVAEDSALQPPKHLMMLSTAALSTDATAPRTMQLRVLIQGNDFLFLVDSGSSLCFIDGQKAMLLSGSHPLALPIPVKVDGGAILQTTHYFPQLQWEADGAQFHDTFKVIDLASYDGIIGLDWLGKYSPMTTHWEEGWIAFQHEGRQFVLRSDQPIQCTHALVQISTLQEE